MRPLARRRQRGAILIMVVLSIMVLLSFAAMAIDLSFLMMKRQAGQNALDAAAHAGMFAYTRSQGDPDQATVVAEQMMARHGFDTVTVELGAYDFDDRSFAPGTSRANGLRVSLDGDDVMEGELFLAPRLGLDFGDRGGALSAIAAIQPREIYFVLDQSGSMSDDAKVASMTQGVVQALDAMVEADPHNLDEVALIGFADTAQLHTPLTSVSGEYATLRDSWETGLCMCSLDPYVQYYAVLHPQLIQLPWLAEAFDTVHSRYTYDESELHPLEMGDAHYGTAGNAELNFRCCEPHCDDALDAAEPLFPLPAFFTWMDTYRHGNGVLWGLQVLEDELVDNGRPGVHRVAVVLGDGLDFCPGGASAAAMPAPCSTGGSITDAAVALATDLHTDHGLDVYPVYYGNSEEARDYYGRLAQGMGEVFNPDTPEGLRALFSEIVWRADVVLVPTG